ncbi:MFS transporter [Sinorhizobium terangae]|uniref:MFS transporter n=2 Tax=Sinorhizobium terangae TaxID=110322 RepID=A0A6N7LCD8_SINTE|nr:multidrug effflux MFS transporter [Sinorhizobium terangae]MQX14595.1 MFS transporter [Sinorhizobium terangae]
MAIEALALDIMLPALPDIGAAFQVADPNDRSLVLTMFLIGFGLPQVVFGPLCDRFGRRRPILIGIAVYIACALASAAVRDFSELLSLRFAQGVAAAAIRVGMISAVRDRYEGAAMSEVVSVALSIFLLIPLFMPGVGQIILLVGPWELIFVAMGGLAAMIGVWTFLRMPETLALASRRPLDFTSVVDGFAIVIRNRTGFSYGLSGMFLLGIIFALINTSQQVYVDIYGLGPYYPLAFAAMPGAAIVGFLVNSHLVARFGMRRLAHGAMLLFLAGSVAWLAMVQLATPPLWLFSLMIVLVTPMVAFGFPNTGALAMEPLGEVAGTASAIFGAIQTVGGAILGWAVAQSFDGTLTPVIASLCIFGTCVLACFLVAEKGRLFGDGTVQNAPAADA